MLLLVVARINSVVFIGSLFALFISLSFGLCWCLVVGLFALVTFVCFLFGVVVWF